MPVEDLKGDVYGRLTVLRLAGKTKWWNAIWLCRCSCDGKEIEVVAGQLKSGLKAVGALHAR